MANNYLYATRETPFQSLIQGFTTGQGIMTNINRNQLIEAQAAKNQLLSAIKLHDELKGMAYDNLDFYNQKYRPAMIQSGMPADLLPEYSNVNDLNNGLYRTEQINAMFKQKLEGPKVVPERGAIYEGGAFKYPEVSPARQAMLNDAAAQRQSKFDVLAQKFGYDKALQMIRQENALAQIEARGNIEKPGSYEMVETDEGPAWSPKGKGELIPIPGAKGKSKAGQDTDIRSKALKATQDQGSYPGDPDFDAKFNANMKIIGGGSIKTATPPQNKKAITRTGTYNGRKVIQYSDGSIEYAD